MRDHRINQNGKLLPFTCQNRQFKTDISRGYAHYPEHNHLGSVTPQPIYDSEDGFTLWLEYVENIQNGNKCMWFMWYDEDGISTMPMSSVIDEVDIKEVIKNISEIKF